MISSEETCLLYLKTMMANILSFQKKAFDTISEAYKYGAKTYGLGKFLLQECNDNADKVQIISNLGLGLA